MRGWAVGPSVAVLVAVARDDVVPCPAALRPARRPWRPSSSEQGRSAGTSIMPHTVRRARHWRAACPVDALLESAGAAALWPGATRVRRSLAGRPAAVESGQAWKMHVSVRMQDSDRSRRTGDDVRSATRPAAASVRRAQDAGGCARDGAGRGGAGAGPEGRGRRSAGRAGDPGVRPVQRRARGCRLAAAVRWLHEHGAGRVDVVLRDAGSVLLVAWPCGVAARRPQSTEGDAVRAAIGVPARLERARSRVRSGGVRAERADPAAVDRAPTQPASRNASARSACRLAASNSRSSGSRPMPVRRSGGVAGASGLTRWQRPRNRGNRSTKRCSPAVE